MVSRRDKPQTRGRTATASVAGLSNRLGAEAGALGPWGSQQPALRAAAALTGYFLEVILQHAVKQCPGG